MGRLVGYNVFLNSQFNDGKDEKVRIRVRKCEPVDPVFNGLSMRADRFHGSVELISTEYEESLTLKCSLDLNGMLLSVEYSDDYKKVTERYKQNEIKIQIMQAMKRCFIADAEEQMGKSLTAKGW